MWWLIVFLCGLYVWDDVWVVVGLFFFGWRVLVGLGAFWVVAEEALDDGEFFGDFEGGCECSEGGVGGGLFDEL